MAVLISKSAMRELLFPAVDAAIAHHLKYSGWCDDACRGTIKWTLDAIPDDVIEEYWDASCTLLPNNFSERIVHALLPRRYWHKKPEPRDPAKATRWRRARCRAGIS